MYCKTTNLVNKTSQYLDKSLSILKEHSIFDRFKIDTIEYKTHVNDDGEKIDYTIVIYSVDDEHESLWLENKEYKECGKYSPYNRDTIFFLLAMDAKKFYSKNLFKLDNFSFNEKEIEILTLAGYFFLLDIFFLHEGSVNHVDIPNMKLFSRNECYELGYMINLPRFSISDYLPSFKITSLSSEVGLSVIEPKEMVGTESKNPLVDYATPYALRLTFEDGIDKGNLNEERMSLLFSALDGKVVSTDTNLRDLYFNAHQYLRIANIKEEKLVSITVEKHGETTRYLGGLYSGFSISTSRTEGAYPTLPFPNTRVSIGGQDVDIACSMSEIEIALGLN